MKAFPKGLRIFAGDPFNKAPIEHNAAEFICQVRADFSRSLVRSLAERDMEVESYSVVPFDRV